MKDITENLHFYKLMVKFNQEGGGHEEAGYIATEVVSDIVQDRLTKSSMIETFELTKVDIEEVEFPINLIEINQLYESLEDLKKDYMVSKLSGVI